MIFKPRHRQRVYPSASCVVFFLSRFCIISSVIDSSIGFNNLSNEWVSRNVCCSKGTKFPYFLFLRRSNMSRDNVIIISGFPGVGKSHLKNALPEGMVADSDSSLFNKEHFPSNYIKHIKFLIEETNVRFILVSSHEEVREALMEAHLNFVLVTPTSDQKEAYLDRYRKRGSPLSFISLMEDKWDEFLGSCVAEQQVTLLPDSYLLDSYTEIYRRRQPIYRDQDPYLAKTVKTVDDYEVTNKVEFSTWLESLKKNERLYIHKHPSEKIYLEKDGFLVSGDVYALIQNRKFLVCQAPNEEISYYAYFLLDPLSGEAFPLLTEEVVEEPRLFQHMNANTKENDSFITVVGNEFKAWLEDLNEGEAVHVRIGGIDQETTSDRFEVNDSLWGVVDVSGFYIGVPKEPMEHSYYLFDPDSPQAFPIFKKKIF